LRSPLGKLDVVVLGILTISCAARMPTVEEVNDVVLQLREYRAWGWMLGIGAIWADLALPVPQTAVIAALGLIYGAVGGGLLGSLGLITGGLLGYALARRYGRGPVARLIGDRSLGRVESWFERAGMWAIVLTRSLPYSVPEAVVCVAGLGGMQASRLLVALSLGSIPTAFVFSAIGAGWEEQPALALAISYVLPIPLLPVVLYVMRGRSKEQTGS
jgi:uncharacterized membrane protein YdjX (TVP38/TMEM64 family)